MENYASLHCMIMDDILAPKAKGRSPGAVNYKHDLLIDIVEKYLPNGALAWQEVCKVYMKLSKEHKLCDWQVMRKNWQNRKSFCNGNKKPTGKEGEKGDCILHCVAIERKIMERQAPVCWAIHLRTMISPSMRMMAMMMMMEKRKDLTRILGMTLERHQSLRREEMCLLSILIIRESSTPPTPPMLVVVRNCSRSKE